MPNVETSSARVPGDGMGSRSFNLRTLLNFSAVTGLIEWVFDLLEDGDYIAGDSPHAILFFVVPVLLNFLQLKYQGKDNSPFETHPKSTYLAAASFLAYCVAYDAKRSRRFPSTVKKIAYFCSWFFGYLSLASLASVVFPDSVTLAPYLLCFLIAVAELIYCIYDARMMEEGGGDYRSYFRKMVAPVKNFFISLWRELVEFANL